MSPIAQHVSEWWEMLRVGREKRNMSIVASQIVRTKSCNKMHHDAAPKNMSNLPICSNIRGHLDLTCTQVHQHLGGVATAPEWNLAASPFHRALITRLRWSGIGR
jgi:hypothetical protein